MRLLLLVLLAGLLTTACASTLAKGSSDKPPLDVPPPPPHAIELPAEPLEPVGEIPSAPGGTSPGSSRPARPAPPKPEPSKPETKPDTTPATAPSTEPAPVPTPPAASNPQLRTPQTADTSTAARNVRTMIDRARKMLSSVNFPPLSDERKKAYNEAQLFIQQAEDALKAGNIVFAQASASKAETLATQLSR